MFAAVGAPIEAADVTAVAMFPPGASAADAGVPDEAAGEERVAGILALDAQFIREISAGALEGEM